MIFPNIQTEEIVQQFDKTRLDASKSFISKDEASITLIEVEPEAGSGFITIGSPGLSKDWYIDWEYSTAGEKTVTCRVTTDGSPVEKSVVLNVLTEAEDYLFSKDSDLIGFEPEILKWVSPGRNSFINIHRKAQKLILSAFDEKGFTDTNGNRLTASAVVDIEEVRQWSTALTLKLIFQSLSNQNDDIFATNAKYYESEESKHKNKAFFRLDLNNDATISQGEGVTIKSGTLYRR